MWNQDLFINLEKLKDSCQSEKMSQYMQNKFVFLGIPKPRLTAFLKPYLKESKKDDLDWAFVNLCFSKDYREAQYVALEYLKVNINKIHPNHLLKLKELITQKSWWDTVDTIDAFIGKIVQEDKTLEKTMLEWSLSANLWLRRVAIDFSQKYQDKTNPNLLGDIIINNLGSKEIFINKAIGWSLREYSKTNPEWVKNFLHCHQEEMSSLSLKEARKYL